MRNILIALDGTWNQPGQRDQDRVVPSNVVKMVRAAAIDESAGGDDKQLRYYDAGVGTAGRIDKIWGGVAGRGLFGNMRQAYAWLMQHYRDGDRLFLIGFSRGAFAARSLAGLLDVCGIPRQVSPQAPRFSPPNAQQAAQISRQATRIYRMSAGPARNIATRNFRARHYSNDGTVNFIGVWDTVGALGLPTRGPVGWLTRRRHGFHNARLGTNILNAYHALAINEKRAPFQPTLWQWPLPQQIQNIEQVWFAGVHSNVGGGYVDAGLSDIALKWMLEKAEQHGLLINHDYVQQRIDPNVFGELRCSLSPMYRAPLLGRAGPREILTGAPGEAIHPTALQRWQAPSRPEEPPANVLQRPTA
ncbi:MAG: DUF2235 domain-containing protein [Pseudomonadota bacterium]|nr:DUF2235 domain-containing protein [Pseudomonadota bacterium]